MNWKRRLYLINQRHGKHIENVKQLHCKSVNKYNNSKVLHKDTETLSVYAHLKIVGKYLKIAIQRINISHHIH